LNSTLYSKAYPSDFKCGYGAWNFGWFLEQ
jgi:hypothetical protein